LSSVVVYLAIVPVIVILCVMSVQFSIYSVSGGLSMLVVDSAKEAVWQTAVREALNGKEWFMCKCVSSDDVLTMFGPVYIRFRVVTLEGDENYNCDTNTKMEIFARSVAAVSDMQTFCNDLALS
jgi:hypothetical protein